MPPATADPVFEALGLQQLEAPGGVPPPPPLYPMWPAPEWFYAQASAAAAAAAFAGSGTAAPTGAAASGGSGAAAAAPPGNSSTGTEPRQPEGAAPAGAAAGDGAGQAEGGAKPAGAAGAGAEAPPANPLQWPVPPPPTLWPAAAWFAAQQAAAVAAAAAQQQVPPPLPVQQQSPGEGGLQDTPSRREAAAAPGTPGSAKDKAGLPIELNLAERTSAPASGDATPARRALGTPVSLALATPPPRSAFRAEAPAFVPGGGYALAPMLPSGEPPAFATPAKEAKPEEADSAFMEARARMLRMRCDLANRGLPEELPDFKFGTVARAPSEDMEPGSAEVGGTGAEAKAADSGEAQGAEILRQLRGGGEATPGKGQAPATPPRKGQRGEQPAGAASVRKVLPMVAPASPMSPGGKAAGKGESRSKIRASAAAARASPESLRVAEACSPWSASTAAGTEGSTDAEESPNAGNVAENGGRAQRRRGGQRKAAEKMAEAGEAPLKQQTAGGGVAEERSGQPRTGRRGGARRGGGREPSGCGPAKYQ